MGYGQHLINIKYITNYSLLKKSNCCAYFIFCLIQYLNDLCSIVYITHYKNNMIGLAGRMRNLTTVLVQPKSNGKPQQLKPFNPT